MTEDETIEDGADKVEEDPDQLVSEFKVALASLFKDEPPIIELYKIFREKCAHEDTLISQRITWFVTFQTVLFAAFGLIVSKNPTTWDIPFVLILAVGGIAIAIGTITSIKAADKAIRATNRTWKAILSANKNRSFEEFFEWKVEKKEGLIASKFPLPALIGAGDGSDAHEKGLSWSLLLPKTVIATWAVLLLLQVYIGWDFVRGFTSEIPMVQSLAFCETNANDASDVDETEPVVVQ